MKYVFVFVGGFLLAVTLIAVYNLPGMRRQRRKRKKELEEHPEKKKRHKQKCCFFQSF